MSRLGGDDPQHMKAAASAVEVVIAARERDLGGFTVRRVLPSAERQRVGPFIFFDQMGPVDFPPGAGIDVRPHPHIGLATVTYLFEGEILHRDSLGSVQPIRPGELNWMTAGRGIVHSERTAPEVRAAGGRLWGIQAWVALPTDAEECAPAFVHHDGADLPVIESDGARVRLIAGTFGGRRAAVVTASPTLYADVELAAGTRLAVPAEHAERAVYPVTAAVDIDSQAVDAGTMAVLTPGRAVLVSAERPSRLMLLGGEALDGERHIWWNLVSSSRARIEQAKDDWRYGRFAAVPGDDAFIPLPDD